MKMKINKIKLITYSALFAAAIYVMTMVSIPLPMGYVHVGDALIMLCACLLPTPYAVIASAIGGSLADLTLAYTAYIPFTFIIKGLIALCFCSKSEKIICRRSLTAFVPVLLLTPGGYYLAECILTGSFIAPVATLFPNLMQAVASIVLFCVAGIALDKFNIKKHLHI
ncbi:MAG: TIGR04002 family protein [Ruminococcaceae bacterium]|nr:TIGR04002 family protein [Oscillospiraceae bacterium]